MSKFYEALERAGRHDIQEPAPALRADSPPAPPPPPEPSGEVPPRAPHVDAPFARPPARARDVTVGRSKGIRANLVSLLNPRSFEAEQYRMLRHAVETMRKEANLQVVAITSPGVGDGKTTTAINLAGALAQSADARVLLVDIDIRHPAVARQLGLTDSKRSLAQALLDSRLTLSDTVEHLAHFNLSVLPAGGPVQAPYELLKSPCLGALLEEGRQLYDFIVLDTPPFVPVPDCRMIARHIDGFLTVVSAHRTTRGMLAEAIDMMDPAKAMGFVFNGGEASRRYGYGVDVESPRAARWRSAWRTP